MLVLSRKRDEAILIGPDVEVFVVRIDGDKVKLGINAPDDVVVLRRELFDEIVRSEPEDAERIWQQGIGLWKGVQR